VHDGARKLPCREPGAGGSGGGDIAGGDVYYRQGNKVIKEWIATNGTVTTLFSSGLNYRTGVAVDLAGNNYISDSENSAVKKWTAATGKFTMLAQEGLNLPMGMVVDSTGNVYFSDYSEGIIGELPRAVVDSTAKLGTLAAGTDALPVVLPATKNLLAPFAPASYQAWLSITGVTNGVVS